jgi:hypothetical protein
MIYSPKAPLANRIIYPYFQSPSNRRIGIGPRFNLDQSIIDHTGFLGERTLREHVFIPKTLDIISDSWGCGTKLEPIWLLPVCLFMLPENVISFNFLVLYWLILSKCTNLNYQVLDKGSVIC